MYNMFEILTLTNDVVSFEQLGPDIIVYARRETLMK